MADNQDSYYSNPEIPEGINISKEHPLKEFIILTVGVLGCIFLAVFILSLLAEKLAVYIPFSMEQKLVTQMDVEEGSPGKFETFLQKRTDELVGIMGVPESMPVHVHFVDDEVRNAFASLGGNIYIHRGLLELIPNENALTMVLAHEIAHIRDRHPIIATGRGVVVGLFILAITGFGNDSVINRIVQHTGTVGALSFSRKQERDSDLAALAAVNKYYHHVNGAMALFENLLLEEKKELIKQPQFLSTHPLSAGRIEGLREFAREQGWQISGQIVPLPEY